MKDVALIIHFLGVAMGVGTSFAFIFLGIQSSKLEEKAGQQFMINAFALSKMGNIGLILLFLSGGYLATDLWANILLDTLFLTKMILFLVLGALLGIIGSNAKKAKNVDDPTPFLNRIKLLGNLTTLIGISIVIIAVLRFN